MSGSRRRLPAPTCCSAIPALNSYLGGTRRAGRRTGGEGSARLSGPDSRVQRLHGADRLHGRLLRPADPDARRGPALRRDRPRGRPFPAPPPDPPVARYQAARPTVFNLLAMGAGLGGAATGIYARRLRPARPASATILSISAYSRELEAEADAMGLRLIAESRLRPGGDARDLAAADRARSRPAPRCAASGRGAAIRCSPPTRRRRPRMADLRALGGRGDRRVAAATIAAATASSRRSRRTARCCSTTRSS